MKYKIHLSPPHMCGREMQYVHAAFAENRIAPGGANGDAFEEALASTTGSAHAVALSSGTAALHLSMLALGVGPGDLVLCQSLTFVASANPILYVGATPAFIDSEPYSWNMCANALERAIGFYLNKGKKPKALILVHLYGMPCDMDPILEICNRYEIPVIEDAAEALGSAWHGKSLGTFGQTGVISFNGNKIIATSAGGALLTNERNVSERARFWASQAKDRAPFYQHSEVGFNYAMSNVCAGIGRGQLEVLQERVEKRRAIFDQYKTLMQNIEGIEFQTERPEAYSNRWLTAFRMKDSNGAQMEFLRKYLESQSIESRRIWKPMHLQPLFKDAAYFGSNVAESIFETGLCLPSGSALRKDEIAEISTHLIHALNTKKLPGTNPDSFF